MAFRDAYERITADPDRVPKVAISLGQDKGRRADALALAVAKGLLFPDHPVVVALTAPVAGAGVVALLEGAPPERALPAPAQDDLEEARSRWANLKARLTGKLRAQADEKAAARAEQKAAEEARRDLLVQQAAELLARGGA
jgi:hypothetical protein